jgi:hypothetical protein
MLKDSMGWPLCQWSHFSLAKSTNQALKKQETARGQNCLLQLKVARAVPPLLSNVAKSRITVVRTQYREVLFRVLMKDSRLKLKPKTTAKKIAKSQFGGRSIT